MDLPLVMNTGISHITITITTHGPDTTKITFRLYIVQQKTKLFFRKSFRSTLVLLCYPIKDSVRFVLVIAFLTVWFRTVLRYLKYLSPILRSKRTPKIVFTSKDLRSSWTKTVQLSRSDPYLSLSVYLFNDADVM